MTVDHTVEPEVDSEDTNPTEQYQDTISPSAKAWAAPKIRVATSFLIGKKDKMSLDGVSNILRALKTPLWTSTDGVGRYLGDRLITEEDKLRLRVSVESLVETQQLPVGLFEDAISLVCNDTKKNPFHELYFNKLKPTDTHHLDDWLIKYCGAEDTELNRIIGKKFLVSAVARMLQPGSFTRGVLCLIGLQDDGKSYLCKVICPRLQWHCVGGGDLSDTQKTAQTFHGKAIIELAENTHVKKSDENETKKFFTTTEDTFTPKYKNEAITVPRTQSYIITTNNDNILTDATGDSRYWVVNIDTVNFNKLKSIKDQMWKEALDLYESHKDDEQVYWTLLGEERILLNESNRNYRIEDPFALKLDEFLEGKENIQIETLLSEVNAMKMGMDFGYTFITINKLRGALKNTGRDSHRVKGVRVWNTAKLIAESKKDCKE